MDDCRPGCGACCVVPTISSLGKPAGLPCPHLDAELRCSLYGRPERPSVCRSLRPEPGMCGRSAEEAHALLWRLEVSTRPAGGAPALP